MDEIAVLPGGVVKGRRNPLYFTLAERLQRARDASGLSARRVSLSAGLSDTAAGTIERGRVPGIDVAERLAQALQLSPCYLAYGVEGPPLPPLGEDEPLRSAGCGARLQRLREHQGLTRTIVGKAAGLTAQAVLNTEEGRTLPTVDTVERLAVALGCSPCWLAFGEGPDPIAEPGQAAAEAQRVRFRPPRKPPAPRRRRAPSAR